MLTTHMLHAKKEPLPRSGDPRMKESLPPPPSRHWHTEDTRLISLRVKKGGGTRHFMKLLGATLLSIDMEARVLVDFSRVQSSHCHSPDLCSWAQGLLAHSTAHRKAEVTILWHWVGSSLLKHALSPCHSADFDVRSFSFYTKAGESNCYTVGNYESLTWSRAGSWEGPFMCLHLAYCL